MATPEAADRDNDGDGDDDGNEVGQRLRDARRAVGLTQQVVADRLKCSRRAVSEWETGVRQPHTALPELAALYGVSTSFLLYGVEPSSVELRELRADVAALALEVKTNQGMLVALAEAIESTFAELRRLLERR